MPLPIHPKSSTIPKPFQNTVESMLREDEQLLWAGQPKSTHAVFPIFLTFPLLVSIYWGIMKTWVAFGLYWPFPMLHHPLCIGLVGSFFIYLAWNQRKQNLGTLFLVTDQRLFRIQLFTVPKISTVQPIDLEVLECVEKWDGSGNLSWRKSHLPVHPLADLPTFDQFEGIRQVHQVSQLLQNYLVRWQPPL